MKKSSIMALLLIGVGLMIMGTTYLVYRGKPAVFNSKSISYIHETFECSQEIYDILIQERAEDVKVELANVSYPSIKYVNYKGKEEVKVTDSAGVLSFYRPAVNTNFVGVNMQEDTDTTLVLPKDYSGTLTIRTSSGDITADKELKLLKFEAEASSGDVLLSSFSSEESAIIKTTSGDISMSNISTGTFINISSSSGTIVSKKLAAGSFFVATSTSGDMVVEGLAAGDSVDFSASSGSLKLSDIAAAKGILAITTSGSIYSEDSSFDKIDFEASSGSITLVSDSASSVKVKTTSGTISLDKLEADSISLEASSGSIKGTIDGEESDYSIISTTSSGSSNLKDKREGSKTLDVKTTSGSIKLSFK